MLLEVKNYLEKSGEKVKMQSYARRKELAFGKEKHRGEGRAAQGRHLQSSDDANCSGTPSGGYVVDRCWEACSSWVPVPLFGLSLWLAG